MQNKTKRLVNLSLFIAMATMLNYFERFIPITIAIPGVKLGIANVVTLVTLAIYGRKDAFMLIIIRTTLASLFYGGFGSLIYSLAGGLTALLIMSILWRWQEKYISIIGISVLGALGHNVGQVLAAAFILQTPAIFSYLSILLVSAVVTGVIIGIVGQRVIAYLKIHIY